MIPILFEDEAIVAVDKPSGLLTVPDRWDKKEDNLHGLLESRSGKKIWVVHRLDKETSGVVLFAKTSEAHRHLSLQFETHFVRKEYRALAHGLLREDSGSWAYALAEDLRHPGRMVASPVGKFAQTDFKVLERFPKAQVTWLSLSPQTGRTHQIRVHMRCAGHAVIGDDRYGLAKDGIYLSRLKRAYKPSQKYRDTIPMAKSQLGHVPVFLEKPLLSRLALHACAVEFKHPTSDRSMTIRAELPKDLELTLKYLKKLGA